MLPGRAACPDPRRALRPAHRGLRQPHASGCFPEPRCCTGRTSGASNARRILDKVTADRVLHVQRRHAGHRGRGARAAAFSAVRGRPGSRMRDQRGRDPRSRHPPGWGIADMMARPDGSAKGAVPGRRATRRFWPLGPPRESSARTGWEHLYDFQVALRASVGRDQGLGLPPGLAPRVWPTWCANVHPTMLIGLLDAVGGIHRADRARQWPRTHPAGRSSLPLSKPDHRRAEAMPRGPAGSGRTGRRWSRTRQPVRAGRAPRDHLPDRAGQQRGLGVSRGWGSG